MAAFSNVMPQADGRFREWDLVVGDSQAWRCVDDPTTNDGDLTYVRIPAGKRASFRLWGSIKVDPVSLNFLVSTKAEGGSTTLQYGFVNKDGLEVYNATVHSVTTAAYGLAIRTFPTSPFTGLAWTPDEMDKLEVVAKVTGANPARLGRFATSLTYFGFFAVNHGAELTGGVTS